MRCDACSAEMEKGRLVVSPPPPYWHVKRDPFLLRERAVEWPGLLARAASIQAHRCRACRTITVGARSECVHQPQQGYLFLLAALRWWPRDVDFEPTVWFPLSDCESRGGSCEMLFEVGGGWRPRLAGTRCRECGWISVALIDVGPTWLSWIRMHWHGTKAGGPTRP
jgi:hypothetical protein